MNGLEKVHLHHAHHAHPQVVGLKVKVKVDAITLHCPGYQTAHAFLHLHISPDAKIYDTALLMPSDRQFSQGFSLSLTFVRKKKRKCKKYFLK